MLLLSQSILPYFKHKIVNIVQPKLNQYGHHIFKFDIDMVISYDYFSYLHTTAKKILFVKQVIVLDVNKKACLP